MDQRMYRREKRVPVLGVMLRKEELAFIKAIPTFSFPRPSSMN
jgi:hypothetical protein